MAEITGTSGSETLTGTKSDDIINAGAGNDIVNSGNGDDTINGGSGSDTLNGGAGSDTLVYTYLDSASGDRDVYTGGSGIDTVRLVLTSTEWSGSNVQAQINAYLDHLDAVKKNPAGEVSNGLASDFKFLFSNGATLTVQMMEKLVVTVGGVVVIDSSDVTVLALAAPDLVASSDSGSSATDNLTNDATPTLSGSGAEPFATIKLYDGADFVGQTVADLSGNWSITVASPLADGSHILKATQTDLLGNTSSPSTALVVTVDNTNPVAGTLSFTNLTDTGSNDTPDITTDGTFNLSLAGDSDANGVSVAYEVSTDDGTTWTSTTNSQTTLADESYQFRAVVTDPAGNSATTAAILVTVDNTNPVAGTLSFTNLTDTGSNDTPDITTDGTFNLSLAGDSDANGVSVAYERSFNAGAFGATATSQSGLADGSYQYRAVVTDAAGNSSTSNAISVVIDNTAPTAGTLSFTSLTDTGSDNTPDITTDNVFNLSLAGTSDANATTVVYERSFNAGAFGATATSQSGLADGSYQYAPWSPMRPATAAPATPSAW